MVRSGPDGGTVVRFQAQKDVRWRRPHLRTPGYVHGACGVIMRVQGPFANPEEVSFYSQGPQRTDSFLYTVRFLQKELWPHYSGGATDTVDVDIFEAWLLDADVTSHVAAGSYDGSPSLWRGRGSNLVRVRTAASAADGENGEVERRSKAPRVDDGAPHTADRGHGHGHGHSDNHVHESRRPSSARLSIARPSTTRGVDKDGAFAALHAATVRLLVAKGVIVRDELRAMVETLDGMAYGQTMEGATLVARAWCDDTFKALLLADPAKAIEAAGLTGVVNARVAASARRARASGTLSTWAPPFAARRRKRSRPWGTRSWSWSRTRRRSTTSWSVPCARAIRARSSGCRRATSRRARTVHAPSANRVPCSRSSAASYRRR